MIVDYALGNEYPKAVYKDGGGEEVWGAFIQTSSVDSRDEELEALARGWRLHPLKSDPLDHDGDGRKGGSVEALDQKGDEELRGMAEEMQLGLHHKTGRAKLLAAIRSAKGS